VIFDVPDEIADPFDLPLIVLAPLRQQREVFAPGLLLIYRQVAKRPLCSCHTKQLRSMIRI